MNKITCLVLCSVLAISFAERPSWYPKDFAAIARKCNDAHPGLKTDLGINKQPDQTEADKNLLCRMKGANVYNEETGLDVDRVKYLYKSTKKVKCDKPVVQECVDRHRQLTGNSEQERALQVAKCIIGKDMEMIKTGC